MMTVGNTRASPSCMILRRRELRRRPEKFPLLLQKSSCDANLHQKRLAWGRPLEINIDEALRPRALTPHTSLPPLNNLLLGGKNNTTLAHLSNPKCSTSYRGTVYVIAFHTAVAVLCLDGVYNSVCGMGRGISRTKGEHTELCLHYRHRPSGISHWDNQACFSIRYSPYLLPHILCCSCWDATSLPTVSCSQLLLMISAVVDYNGWWEFPKNFRWGYAGDQEYITSPTLMHRLLRVTTRWSQAFCNREC